LVLDALAAELSRLILEGFFIGVLQVGSSSAAQPAVVPADTVLH
jgi:hypothetical protein